MTETQLLSSTRLEKLEDLVNAVNVVAGIPLEEYDQEIVENCALRTMINLIELQDLAGALLRDIATKHKISQE
jgi:hypothetical protein